MGAGQSAMREEACGPRLDEIEFETIEVEGKDYLFGFYFVARVVQYLDGRVVVEEGRAKNETRMRWLVIPPPYSERLREIVDDLKGEGYIWLLDDGFGSVMSPDTMTTRYRRWFLGKHHKYIPFNNLRNSYGTVMHGLGLDLGMVGKLMGHKDQATTYKFYDRPGKEELLRAVASVRL